MNNSELCDPCDEFDLLLSCAGDNELQWEQQIRLSRHLEQCEICRARQCSFETLNQWVAGLGSAVVVAPQSQIDSRSAPHKPLEKSAKHGTKKKWKQVLVRVAATAVAVTIVAGSFAANWFWVSNVAATQVQAADIAEPLVHVSEINFQRELDQQSLAETMDLELRVLKLEIASIRDKEIATALAARIDELLKKIKTIEITKSKIL